MEVSTKRYHNSFIQIVVNDGNTKIVIDVIDNNGKVSESVIEQFKEVVAELEEYNEDWKLKNDK